MLSFRCSAVVFDLPELAEQVHKSRNTPEARGSRCGHFLATAAEHPGCQNPPPPATDSAAAGGTLRQSVPHPSGIRKTTDKAGVGYNRLHYPART